MSPTVSLGVARVVIAVSTLAALAAHAWLTIGHAWLPCFAVAALALGAIGGWTWRRGTQALILAVGHVWPLVMFAWLGTVDALASMIWISALAALALATSPLTRWSLPPSWQMPVAAWGILLTIGWPIVLARELDFTLITYFENGTMNGVWTAAPRDTAAYLTGATAAALTAIVVVDWLWARYGSRSDERFVKDVMVPLTIGTVVALLIGVYQATVDLRWWNIGVWPVLGRATGTFFDSNAFGAVAALWATPVAGAALLSARRTWRTLGAALLALTAVAVWGSGSRTALLGFLVACTGIAAALLRAGWLSRRTAALVAAGAAIVIAAGWLIGGPGSALRRVWSTLPSPSIEGIVTFAASMWNRDGYGSAAVAMVRDHPLTGVGPGAFQLFVSDYWLMLSGLMIAPDNAQNWWRHQVAELGLVAGLVPIACSLLVLGAAVAATRRGQRPIGMVAAGAVAGAACMSLMGSPVAHPIVLLTVATAIFWLTKTAAHSTGSAGSAGSAGWRVVALIVVWLLPIAWGGMTLWTAVQELRPPQRAEAFGWLYAYGFSAPKSLGGGAEERWAAHRAVAVIPALGPNLVLTLQRGQFDDAEPVHIRVSTRHQVVVDQTLDADDVARATLPFAPGQRWMMVQFETWRRGQIVEGAERALHITHAFR